MNESKRRSTSLAAQARVIGKALDYQPARGDLVDARRVAAMTAIRLLRDGQELSLTMSHWIADVLTQLSYAESASDVDTALRMVGNPRRKAGRPPAEGKNFLRDYKAQLAVRALATKISKTEAVRVVAGAMALSESLLWRVCTKYDEDASNVPDRRPPKVVSADWGMARDVRDRVRGEVQRQPEAYSKQLRELFQVTLES